MRSFVVGSVDRKLYNPGRLLHDSLAARGYEQSWNFGSVHTKLTCFSFAKSGLILAAIIKSFSEEHVADGNAFAFEIFVLKFERREFEFRRNFKDIKLIFNKYIYIIHNFISRNYIDNIIYIHFFNYIPVIYFFEFFNIRYIYSKCEIFH